MNHLLIRPATPPDLVAINAIYNHYVQHSTSTYQTQLETLESRQAWFAHHGREHPVTVAVQSNEVVGWAALSEFHPRMAFARTVEDSIYVRPNLLRQGIGGALLDDLMVQARQLGHHTIIAAIDGEQAASVALHIKRGFTTVGQLHEVGHKFGRWLDVWYLQLRLADNAAQAPFAPNL